MNKVIAKCPARMLTLAQRAPQSSFVHVQFFGSEWVIQRLLAVHDEITIMQYPMRGEHHRYRATPVELCLVCKQMSQMMNMDNIGFGNLACKPPEIIRHEPERATPVHGQSGGVDFDLWLGTVMPIFNCSNGVALGCQSPGEDKLGPTRISTVKSIGRDLNNMHIRYPVQCDRRIRYGRLPLTTRIDSPMWVRTVRGVDAVRGR